MSSFHPSRRTAEIASNRSTQKKPYITPRLEIYGNVAKLTQSGGTSKTENGVQKMRPS